MKKIKLLLPLLGSLIILGACYDSREIDETAYIIALGVDKSEDASYTYTFQLANPLEMTSGEEDPSGKSADSSVQNFVVVSPDFYIAKNQLNNFLSKNVVLSHLKLIVFSKELENSQFIRHSQFLMHEREVRPHTNIAVSNGTAEDFIKSVKPTLEANTAKYYELMGLRSDNLYAPTVTISTFLDKLSTKDGCVAVPLAHPSAKTDTFQENTTDFWINAQSTQLDSESAALKGLAVFKGGKICGYYDCDGALIFNILSGKLDTCNITLKNPTDKNSNLVFRLNTPKAAKYTIENKNNQYTVTVTQCPDIKFIGSFLPKGFKTEVELYNFARQAISQKISDFVYDLSRNKKTDILDIGSYVKGQLDAPDRWQNIFETAEFKADIS